MSLNTNNSLSINRDIFVKLMEEDPQLVAFYLVQMNDISGDIVNIKNQLSSNHIFNSQVLSSQLALSINNWNNLVREIIKVANDFESQDIDHE